LFPDEDGVLNLIGEPFVIAVALNTIPPTYLGGIAYEIYVISGDLITRLYIEVIQHSSHFNNRV